MSCWSGQPRVSLMRMAKVRGLRAGVGEFRAAAERFDDLIGHALGPCDRRVGGHAVGAAVKAVVDHQDNLALGGGDRSCRRWTRGSCSPRAGPRCGHDAEQVRHEPNVLGALDERLCFGGGFGGVDRETGHGVLLWEGDATSCSGETIAECERGCGERGLDLIRNPMLFAASILTSKYRSSGFNAFSQNTRLCS